MTRKLLTSIAVTVLLVGCTTPQNPPAPGTTPPTAIADIPPSTDPAPPSIELPWLPPQGVVVQRNGGVAFVALDGRVIAKLHGLEIANPTEAPGPVLFRDDSAWYVLDPEQPELERIGRQRADALRTLDDPAIDLPTPPGMTAGGRPAGHWRFALLSTDGNRILAQWSGECEVPIAYLSTLQGGAPSPITGGAAPEDIPESFALGWTRGGLAVAVLPYGACASGADLPGVYGFDSAGSATLITTVAFPGLARMWGAN